MTQIFEWYRDLKYQSGYLFKWFGKTVVEDGVKYGRIDNLYAYYGILLGVILVAYLLGSLNFGILISKLKYKDDIRTHGSGNAGSTNMQRTFGNKAAALTLVCDIMKAVVATNIGIIMGGEMFGYLAGFACILGHAFPVYFGFKGGKGVACVGAMVIVLEPIVGLLCALVFVLTVLFTKYVSLGSIFGSIMYPVLLSSLYQYVCLKEGVMYPDGIVMIIAVLIPVFIVWSHRTNITRIMNKTENKFSLKKKN